jgi:group I intron endonuclease
MRIYRALLKYGYSAFRLEILEFCVKEELIAREQFFFDKYKPELNVLKVAGSTLGFNHSEASKELMSKLAKGRIISAATRLKMSNRIVSNELKTRISAALKGRKASEETRNLKRLALLRRKCSKERLEQMAQSNTFKQPIILTNTETGEDKEFSSLTDAAKFLGAPRSTLTNYLKKNTPLKGYMASKASLEESSMPKGFSQQPVLLINKETGISKEFFSISDAAQYLDVSRWTL